MRESFVYFIPNHFRRCFHANVASICEVATRWYWFPAFPRASNTWLLMRLETSSQVILFQTMTRKQKHPLWEYPTHWLKKIYIGKYVFWLYSSDCVNWIWWNLGSFEPWLQPWRTWMAHGWVESWNMRSVKGEMCHLLFWLTLSFSSIKRGARLMGAWRVN